MKRSDSGLRGRDSRTPNPRQPRRPTSGRVMSIFALLQLPVALGGACSWWYEETAHHGVGFRNVSAFGAIGDGVADDTRAIQNAIDFNRGGDVGSGQSKSAAVVYLGPGTYKVTNTIVLWKWTVLMVRHFPAQFPPF